MPIREKLLARMGAGGFLLASALVFGCRGCHEPSVSMDAGMGGDSQAEVQPQIQPQTLRLLELAGKVDRENRYPFVVIVRTRAQMEEERPGQCGGVLVAPQLVLTAAHCVCTAQPGGDGGVVFDSSACEKVAFATTVGSGFMNGNPTEPGAEDYRGAVRAHPDFKLVLDAQSRVASSTANLAVIILDEPVASEFPRVELADAEVRLHESVTAVSYGYDEVIGGRFGERRFGKARVIQVPGPGGRTLFEQPGSHAYKGESGGAVLREDGGRPALIGILSRSLGEEPSFTSISPYRDWLRGEIQRTSGVARPFEE